MSRIADFFTTFFVYFTLISNILWPFGIYWGISVYFYCFDMLRQQKSGNPVNLVRFDNVEVDTKTWLRHLVERQVILNSVQGLKVFVSESKMPKDKRSK
jgi:hypothetical protein